MFKEFRWKNRLLIYVYNIYKKKDFCEIENFFLKNIKDISERNLLLLKLDIKINDINTISNIKTKKPGLVLIGLDGTEKSHSTDISLINNLFDIIDSMPMRLSKNNKIK